MTKYKALIGLEMHCEITETNSKVFSRAQNGAKTVNNDLPNSNIHPIDMGFPGTLPIVNKALQAITYGDLLIKLLLATRPYEKKKGEAQELYNMWQKICYESVKKGNLREYRKNIKNIIKDFKTKFFD